jgi:hypothetical protein
VLLERIIAFNILEKADCATFMAEIAYAPPSSLTRLRASPIMGRGRGALNPQDL